MGCLCLYPQPAAVTFTVNTVGASIPQTGGIKFGNSKMIVLCIDSVYKYLLSEFI